MQQQIGKVQFYRTNKGYGYIRVEDSREEFYFRAKNLKTPVKDGDMVRFEIKEKRGSLFANNVEKVEAQKV